MKAAGFEWRPLFAQTRCPHKIIGDPACVIGLPNQVQAAASQLSELRGAEVSGPVLRMDAGNMQCLAAQVIAHPRHNGLILQQPHETAAPVSLFAEPCGQLFCIDTGVQQVLSHWLFTRMLY